MIDALASLRGRAILFLDTCKSGAAGKNLTSVARRTAGLVNGLAAPENSVIVFAASTDWQDSVERDDWGNGAFTNFAIEGLKGAAGVSALCAITTRSLSSFVTDGVTRLTEGMQTPVAVIPDTIPDRVLTAVR